MHSQRPVCYYIIRGGCFGIFGIRKAQRHLLAHKTRKFARGGLSKANIYKLEFSWNPRQFHVPTHILYKIGSGASRNFIVRGIAGKVTADEIQEQLGHIHNLVVVDVSFADGDALISTNSIHNALFARTCMMSRTVYKGVKIEWALDECASPLPPSIPKPRTLTAPISTKPTPMKNQYALLDTGSDLDSESEDDSCMSNGIRIDHSWDGAVVA
jgi:hypothetical protein